MSRKRYISPIRGEAPPVNGFLPNFVYQEIFRRNHLCKFLFGKIKGFGIYGGSNFGFWSLAGHFYNSAALPRSL